MDLHEVSQSFMEISQKLKGIYWLRNVHYQVVSLCLVAIHHTSSGLDQPTIHSHS